MSTTKLVPPIGQGFLALVLCSMFAATASPAEDRARGITEITKGPVRLQIPRHIPGGESMRYGMALPFQAGPKTAALLLNIRMEGKGVGDFENGSDVILFDDLQKLSVHAPVPVTRTEVLSDPATGEKRIFVAFPQMGGFVPHGARRADGTPHPHAGTGFTFGESLGYFMKENGAPRPPDPKDPRTEPVAQPKFYQLTFDGKKFEVVDQSPPLGKFLWTEDSRWRLDSPGLNMAIPDGDDLLMAVKAAGTGHCNGVARWVRRRDGWRPDSFHPVREAVGRYEATLARDTDGTLLFTARKGDRKPEDAYALRVWRSRDGGVTWEKTIDVPATLDAGPRGIGTAADGTPFVVGNPVQPDRSYFREALWLWPLNAARTGIEAPMVVRDGPSEFGPAPKSTPWRIDHPIATVLRLADGQWHSVLAFRLYRNDLLRPEGAPKDVQAVSGTYIEEVKSRGPALPIWRFDQ